MHELRRLLTDASNVGHAPRVVEGVGASAYLGRIAGRSLGRVLVVASERTARGVPVVAALLRSGAHHYGRTRANPTVEDALALSRTVEALRPHTVIAVGGGSALDLAKAGRLLSPYHGELDRGLQGRPESLRPDPPRLVAAPTTAGTGAEITPFATLYRGSAKVSLDTPGCRPDLAVLDGHLTATCPDGPGLAAALDALCHSIESGWSLAGTPTSRVYARAARDHLLACLARIDPPSAAELRWDSGSRRSSLVWRHALLLSAAVAGVAIAQTRTTGAHAFAYHLTTRFGVPHGFACAASMSWIEAQIEDRRPEVLEPATREAVESLRRHLDWAQSARLVRLPGMDDAALEDYVEAGLGVGSRMAAHPVSMTRDEALGYAALDGRLVAAGQGSRESRTVALTKWA
ncbi:iron-containing alcohol dehydrogenase [Sinomonas sp. G460-2]|uniref:iron-containing alcohol dehydrogenase n=1 Tax=Sinomonas sp. G460-2 TaxID=3393464 RepID=UPI0039F1254F